MNNSETEIYNTLENEIVLLETNIIKINKYIYAVTELKPHTSVRYHIYCYNDSTLVKHITGLLEGNQYLEWTNDDYLDNFIKEKVKLLDSN
jgi:hypothetical protein